MRQFLETKAKILLALTDEPKTCKQIAEEVGISVHTARRYLNEDLEGKVKKIPRKHTCDRVLYLRKVS